MAEPSLALALDAASEALAAESANVCFGFSDEWLFRRGNLRLSIDRGLCQLLGRQSQLTCDALLSLRNNRADGIRRRHRQRPSSPCACRSIAVAELLAVGSDGLDGEGARVEGVASALDARAERVRLAQVRESIAERSSNFSNRPPCPSSTPRSASCSTKSRTSRTPDSNCMASKGIQRLSQAIQASSRGCPAKTGVLPPKRMDGCRVPERRARIGAKQRTAIRGRVPSGPCFHLETRTGSEVLLPHLPLMLG